MISVRYGACWCVVLALKQVRMPVGWWAFAEESRSNTSSIITDPAHDDRKFVVITTEYLEAQIQRFAKSDGDLLRDEDGKKTVFNRLPSTSVMRQFTIFKRNSTREDQDLMK